MLEHDLWSPGRLTVRTIRDRRDGHVVEVLRDGARVAEGDDEGAIRATSGLVLAEAPLATTGAAKAQTDECRATSSGVEPARPPATSSTGAAEPSAVGLTVDVFGERRGEVRVRTAEESWRRRHLDAELLVDGVAVARLRTLGSRAEEAVVVAGGTELARLARFDHLRGTRRFVSAWDLTVAEIPDERLRATTVAAVLRLPKLRAAAGGRSRRR